MSDRPNEPEIWRTLELTLADLFADVRAFHDEHVRPMRERLQEAGAKAQHAEDLTLLWERVIRTRENVLMRLQGADIKHGRPPSLRDYPSDTSRPTAEPLTEAALAALTDRELVEAIEACEASLRECRLALGSLDARDGSGPADYWLGEDAPSHQFRVLAEWFEQAVAALRRLRQRRALEDHRAGTQFQPLDPASPSVVVRLRVPQALVERLDEAAAARGMTRSEAIRQAVEAWLVE